MPRSIPPLLPALLLAVLGLACGSGQMQPADQTSASPLSSAAALGEQIFKDTSLSASGLQSCATCHVASAAHAPDNDLPIQPGGPSLNLTGTRQAPGIRYLARTPPFHFAQDGTPTGGFFWDGRSDTLAEQAAGPFLNPLEMAMPSKAAVVARLQAAPYAAAFRQVYGASIFSDPEGAYTAMTQALQRYELEDAQFNAFTSRYDAYLRGQGALNAQEARGLALFNNSQKGNCAACHPSALGADGSLPLFTDFTYDVLGVPRNPAIPANADPAHFDLGLGAREKGDLANRQDLYGAFKVPSLRNVARRRTFFHNGRFSSLRDAVTFYIHRDIHPERYYPVGPDGTVAKYDDLPPRYHRNVNTLEVPYNRVPGDPPALTDAEIEDLLAFLQTLNDQDN
jgi:cytochrome c peroxidase